MVFVNDDWELDTKTGLISTNSTVGKIAIAKVIGATDFNSDNEQAMAHAKLIKAAPKMYGTLQALTFLWSNLNTQSLKVSALMNTANEIISEVEGTETQSCPITQGKWYIRGEDGDDWINPNYGIYSDKDGCTYIVGYITRRGTEEGLANAKLIAAAPEMYELLIKTLDDTQNRQFARKDLICELLTRIDGIKRESQIY